MNQIQETIPYWRKKPLRGSKSEKKSETDVTSTINLGLQIKAIKRYYHQEGNRAAKKEFYWIFTETEVDITDSSYEDATPEQDEVDKDELCKISLFGDKIVHGNRNHISLINLLLLNQQWMIIACLSH